MTWKEFTRALFWTKWKEQRFLRACILAQLGMTDQSLEIIELIE